MEKIFDDEVVKYLKSSGVSKREINKIKFDKLKEQSLRILSQVISLIEEEKFNKVEEYTAYSGSGDGYDSDNNYINFGNIVGTVPMDILELCLMLDQLKVKTKLNEL